MEITIERILNLPVNNGKRHSSINQIFIVTTDNQSSKEVLCSKSFEDLIIKEKQEFFEAGFLYCETDKGEKVTLFDVTMATYFKNWPYRFEKHFTISYNGFLIGKHIKNVEEIKTKSIKVIITHQPKTLTSIRDVRINTGDGINIAVDFLEKEDSDEFKKQLMEMDPTLSIDSPIFKHLVGVEIKSTSKDLKTIEPLIERIYKFQEMVFLIRGHWFSFSHIEFACGRTLLKYCNYFRENKIKWKFQKYLKPLPYESLDWDNFYKLWIYNRDKTYVTFELFRHALCMETFEEDYLLRFIQCVEGYVCGLSIDTHKKEKWLQKLAFRICKTRKLPGLHSCLVKAIRCNNLLLGEFGSSKQRKSTINKMIEHRNWLCHSNTLGTRFDKDECGKYAIKLILTLRILMLDSCNIKLNNTFNVKNHIR